MADSTKEMQPWFRSVTIPQLFPSTVKEFFGAFEMKALIRLFGDTCGADYVMAAAILMTFATVTASAHVRSTSASRGSPPYGHARLEDYRGPRA